MRCGECAAGPCRVPPAEMKGRAKPTKSRAAPLPSESLSEAPGAPGGSTPAAVPPSRPPRRRVRRPPPPDPAAEPVPEPAPPEPVPEPEPAPAPVLADDDAGEVLMGMEPPPRATSKIPLPDTSMIRKTAYGRDQLSINDSRYKEMHCRSSSNQPCHHSSVFHQHAINVRDPSAWCDRTDLLCWHCCAGFDTAPVPIPRSYDTRERCFVVYGNFCSLRCAKGFLVQGPSFDSPQQINLFSKMAHDVYGEDDVAAAPSRYALREFGGPYTLEDFRAKSVTCQVVLPPFITSYMVVEERQISDHNSSHAIGCKETVLGLRRPDQPVLMPRSQAAIPYEEAPYVQFAQKAEAAGLLPPPPPPPGRKTKSAPPATGASRPPPPSATAAAASGSLAAFMV